MKKDNFTKDISLHTFNDIVETGDFAVMGEAIDKTRKILFGRVAATESAIAEIIDGYKDLIFVEDSPYLSTKEGNNYFYSDTKTFRGQKNNIDACFKFGLTAAINNKQTRLYIDRAVARQRGLSAIVDILEKIDVDKLPKTHNEREALFWSKNDETLGAVENAIKYAAIAKEFYMYPYSDTYAFNFREQEDIVKNIQTMKGYALSELSKLNHALDTRNKTELFVESESIKQKICNTKSLEKESLANQIKRNSEKDVKNDEKKTNAKEKEAR